MIPGCISKHVFVDLKIEDACNVSAPLASQIFYDVIRIEMGVPLFLAQHTERFFRSFVLAGFPYVMQKKEFHEFLMEFIICEKIEEGNIRIVYYHDATPSFCIYQVAHTYPTPQMYEVGVASDFLHVVRKDPNIKQELEVRTIANQTIQKAQVFDVVYVDENNMIREGSRTNVFFVKGQKVITALSQDVLCGITRENVIQIVRELNIELEERKIPLAEANQFDAAFFTGTSPKIMPITTLGSYSFAANNSIVSKIMTAYDTKIEDYIYTYKNL